MWKFNSLSIANLKDLKALSISRIVENLNLNKVLFADWYAYSSTHAHTNYWSVVQHDSLTTEQKVYFEQIGIIQAKYLVCCLIKDLAIVEKTARVYLDNLPEEYQKLINEPFS